MSPGAEVLVLRALGLGDLLTSVPALRGLRGAFPRERLVLACPRALHGLVRLWRLADEPLDVRPLGPIPRSFRSVEVAVNLHGAGPQSTNRLLERSPRRLIAFAHDDVPATSGMPAWDPGEHEVERWCRLLVESGIPADPRSLSLAPPTTGPRDSKPIVVHPGAASESRRWPADRWGAVGRALRRLGHEVLLTGSPQERGLAVDVGRRAGVPPDAVVAGRTSLVELAGIVGSARLVVSGDTGVAHLATALDVPSVVLFGPTPPSLWGPPARSRRHRVLWTGRTGDPHGSLPDPGLLEIGVADVLDAATELAA